MFFHKRHGWIERSTVQRITGHKARRHVVGISIGVAIMVVGSSMATSHQEMVPRNVWDAFSYFVHAVGGMPILKHVEGFWSLLVASE